MERLPLMCGVEPRRELTSGSLLHHQASTAPPVQVTMSAKKNFSFFKQKCCKLNDIKYVWLSILKWFSSLPSSWWKPPVSEIKLIHLINSFMEYFKKVKANLHSQVLTWCSYQLTLMELCWFTLREELVHGHQRRYGIWQKQRTWPIDFTGAVLDLTHWFHWSYVNPCDVLLSILL